MNKGNCYEANFKEFISNQVKYRNWKLVHAMRNPMGVSEWWGGHAFLLDVANNRVWDFSNGDIQTWDKDEIYKEWNIQVDGLHMYFEYSHLEAIEWAQEVEHYGSWELLYEDWKSPEWISYMKEYFMPTHQPMQWALRQMKSD